MLQRFFKAQHSRGFALQLGVVATAAIATGFASPVYAQSFTFIPGDPIVSGSTYSGTASSVTVGQTLPGDGTAVANWVTLARSTRSTCQTLTRRQLSNQATL